MITNYYKPKETMSKTGYIYKLCCNDPEIKDCYIGSTKNEKVRKNGHKVRCNGDSIKSQYYVYQFIRDNGGWDNWNMIRLEEYKFDNRAELHTRERYWLEELNATLNKIIPTRTQKEWREEHKEVISEKKKEYREANKEVILKKKKEYRESNKEKIKLRKKIYAENNKEVIAEKNKEYREANKEVIAQKAKEKYNNNKEVILKKHKKWYQNNKQQLLEKAKIKITCECGSTVNKSDLNRHKKSQKHKDYITSNSSVP